MHSALGVRTDFSLGESIIGVNDLSQIASDTGSSVLGVCDTMSVSSLIGASKALAKNDVRLITGVRVRVIMRDDSGRKKEEREKAAYLKLFPVNQAGFEALFKIISRGFEEHRFYFTPRVTWDDLIELVVDDAFIITTGDTDSVIQREDMQDALARLVSQRRFAKRFYELVPSTTPYYTRQNNMAIVWGSMNDFEPLVVSPTFYREGTESAFSINAAITARVNARDFWKSFVDYTPIKLSQIAQRTVEAAKACDGRYPSKDTPAAFLEGLRNTQAFVDAISFKWEKQPPCLPVVSNTPDEDLRELCKKGWLERFSSPMFAHQPTPAELATDYLPRLQFELETLKRLGFAQYFLLVADLVRWAKSQDIFVGPGRGSVGGSLVAYLVGITDVDPIRFKLLFERFINPDRLDLPDADLDFMSTRRDEVISYLENRWGKDMVAGIVNYNTMAARGALRDVGRIHEIPPEHLEVTKLIGNVHGVSLTLEQAKEAESAVEQFSNNFPELWSDAIALEGKMRSFGTHAAGVVVSSEPIVNRAVVERREGNRVINWDKSVSEDQGLVKLDVLGLSNLDMFDRALKLIFKRHSLKININQISLDDQKALDIFNTAKTAGIFQFEGGSVRRLLKEMVKSAPLTFEDLVALNALNRPGPLDAGLTESYIRRRAGDEAVTYAHSSLEPILKDTFGVLTYQEQIMQTARALCGYTPGEADTLRKIMGKKLPEEMKKQREKFVNGAVQISGMAQSDADKLFSEVEGFAGYAFNRSHAVEYTLISFQAAYLKAHYLVEFYAASMGIAGEAKLQPIVAQASRDGIRVIPPDINIAGHHFEPLNDVIVMAPLTSVRNVSDKGVQAIIQARDLTLTPTVIEISSGRGIAKVTTQTSYGPGKFVSIEDFQARVPARAVNARVIDHLDRVGAFARIVPGQMPSTHESRQRDQIELMPGLSDQSVAADRSVVVDDISLDGIEQLEVDMRAALGKAAMPSWIGDDAKFMVILDAPFNDYHDIEDQFSYKEFVRPSLQDAELSAKDALWTWMLRRPKKKGETRFSREEVDSVMPFLRREIEIFKPPVVILLGANVTKEFFPDLKVGADTVGHIQFRADMDATFIIGFNPTQIYHDKSKIAVLTDIFKHANDLFANVA